MYMLEKVTGHTFEYDKKHKLLKIVPDLPDVGVPPPSPTVAMAVEANAP